MKFDSAIMNSRTSIWPALLVVEQLEQPLALRRRVALQHLAELRVVDHARFIFIGGLEALVRFLILSGFRLLSRANSSSAAFLALRAATTDCPVGGAAEAEAPGAPMRPPPPKSSWRLAATSDHLEELRETDLPVPIGVDHPNHFIHFFVGHLFAYVDEDVSDLGRPTKLFLSKSKAVNASQISSSVNLPFGSRAGPAWAAPTSFCCPASLLI